MNHFPSYNMMTHFQGYNNLVKNMHFRFLFFFVLLIGVTAMAEDEIHEKELVEMAGYGEDKLSTVLITGTLLCDYSSRKTQTIQNPVPGAELGVSCQTSEKSSKLIWAKSTTDEYGEFVIDLPSELHSIPKLDHICAVKILRLPGNYCSLCHYLIANNGMQTTGILKLSSVGNGIRTYTAQLQPSKPKSLQM